MDASHTMEMYVVMGLLTALAFFRHRANIMRLAKGTENRVYLGKKDKKIRKVKKGGENGESKCVGSRELGELLCLFFSVKTAMR